MVIGTHVVLTSNYSLTSFIASLIPFFLVNNLLLLNQFPDVEADHIVGRKHLPIMAGRKTSSFIYGVFLLMAYISIIIGVVLGFLPPRALLGLISLVIAIPAFLGVIRFSDDIKRLIPYMGLNVIITLLTPILVSVGLLIS